MNESLSNKLQEDLLILLCFDQQNSKIIKNSVELDLFEGTYREVAKRLYGYIEVYNDCPGENVATLLDDILEGPDKRKANLYEQILSHIYESQKGINAKYVMDRITEFVRQQHMKSGIMEAMDLLQKGGDDVGNKVELILNSRMKKRLDLFDPGVFFGDIDKNLRFLDKINAAFPTGIPFLDRRGLGPSRGRLHVLIGVYGHGKTWWLINLGKRAVISKLKVCHISLEMDEDEVIQRYIQTLFGMSKRNEYFERTLFDLDNLHNLVGFDKGQIRPRYCLEDPKIREKLKARFGRWGARLDNLLIKQFPTSGFSLNQLEAYLDSLENSQGFVPDLIILDYVDLMNISLTDYRLQLGRTVAQLRGIAVKRNLAIATVSQSSKEGKKSSKGVRGEHAAEDWSKMGTADVVLTYSQTEHEQHHGLARLYIDKARSDIKNITLLLSQNYAVGQFVYDSVVMKNVYFDLMEDQLAKV